MTSWIELDPERAPLIRWAFERHGQGDCTVVDLYFALVLGGLTIRPGPSTAARPVSVNNVRRVLPLVGRRTTPAMISSGLVRSTDLWWS